MRVIVCGGRKYADQLHVDEVLDAIHLATPITVLIEGGAGGVRNGVAFGADRLARSWGHHNCPHVMTVMAEWHKYGLAAGPRRNARMLAMKPDLVVAFAGGRGTADMVRQARGAGVRVTIAALTKVTR